MAAQRRTKKHFLGNSQPSFLLHNWVDRILAESRRKIHSWEKLALRPEFDETCKSHFKNTLIQKTN
jgi:hypothetical protein